MKSSLKVVRDFDDLSEEVIHRYLDDGLRTKEQLKEMQTSGHCQLSKYTFRDDYNPDTWNNGIFLTKEGHKLFGEVVKIVQYYNYDTVIQ